MRRQSGVSFRSLIEVLENVKSAARDFFELPVEERRNYLKEKSPTPTVMLKTSFSPYAEKVLEWKDYLLHFAGRKNEGSQFWPPVSRNRMDNSYDDCVITGGFEPYVTTKLRDFISILRHSDTDWNI